MNSFNVSLCYSEQYSSGKLEIQQNKLIFIFPSGSSINIDFIDHMCVYRDEKFKFSDKNDRFILNIITKQLKHFDFLFDEKTDCNQCVSHIQKNFSNCKRMALSSNDDLKFFENAEFVDITEPSFWRLSSLNSNYSICESLPEYVVVVDGISDQALIESKKCHINSRFPIINYVSLVNKSCILTSSSVNINAVINQPTRCHVDEAMIAHLSKDISDKNVYIVQFTTLSSVAIGQQMQNKEKPSSGQSVSGTNLLNSWITWTNYNTFTINVLPINQLPSCLGHMLISLNVLPPKYYPPNTFFGLTTENSSQLWLNSVYMCISKASIFVNQMVKHQTIVYLMDETGVDYTFVVSSLCQILIEPSCRTTDGFMALIYREWFCNGHPFDTRHTSILPDNMPRVNSMSNGAPLIDCASPIQQKYVRYFEFNENLLLHLFKSSYECRLGNNEQSRRSISIDIKQCPLWNFDAKATLNHLYDKYNDSIVKKFWPHEMDLWDSVFLKPNNPSENSSFSEILIEIVKKLVLDAKNE